jgi:hypothetical protein
MTDHDPLDPATLDKSRAQGAARDKLAAHTEAEDVKWLMSSKRGRRIQWNAITRAGVFRLSFNTNSMTMAFAEGARNEGLRALALIHTVCPEMYPLMLKEANE